MFNLAYPVIIALIGAGLLGVCSGMLSCYATLRQQSLLGDVIAHASLPGICLMFVFTFTKHTGWLLLGAFVSGMVAVTFMGLLVRYTLLKMDTVMALILSLFFGAGVFLLAIIQEIPQASQAGLETFLFGSAAALLLSDIYILVVGVFIIVVSIFVFWKELKALMFNRYYIQSLGFSTKWLDTLVTFLLVLTIVLGLQFVGVVLMSALIIAPAVAARQWTDRLSVMMVLAVLFAVLSTSIGVYISSVGSQLSTGPVIVVVICMVSFMSLFFAPKHGVIYNWIKALLSRKELREQLVLSYLFVLARTHADVTHPHDIKTLSLLGKQPSPRLLQSLRNQGWVYHDQGDLWGLTQRGYDHVVAQGYMEVS